MRVPLTWLLVVVTSLMGCATQAPSPRKNEPAADRAPLVVASDLANMPFAGLDAQGRPIGRDIEMMEAIAASLGRPIEWRRMDFETLLYDDEWSKFWFRVPPPLILQMASKGSVAVDGISLTLVDVEAERFSVALIPHTLQSTTLGELQVGGEVNIETDLLAKYVEQQLGGPAKPRCH